MTTTVCSRPCGRVIAMPTASSTPATPLRRGATPDRCSPTDLMPTTRWPRCSPGCSRRSSAAVGPTTPSPPTCSPACGTSAGASSGGAVVKRPTGRCTARPSPRGATGDHAARVAEAAVVRAAFASLPGEMRDILRLTEVDQVPPREIATRLAEDPGHRGHPGHAGPPCARQRLPAPARRHRRSPAAAGPRLPRHPGAHRVVPARDGRLASSGPDRGAPRHVRGVPGRVCRPAPDQRAPAIGRLRRPGRRPHGR